MNVHALLEHLDGRGIRVWAEGERLRCDAPAGELTQELRDQLAQCKQDILRFLRSAESLARRQRAIVPLQPLGSRTPIFGIGGHNGDVFCYRSLARHLGNDQPFHGLQPPGLDGRAEPLDWIEDIAAYFAAQILAFHRGGPLVIAGFCAGGTIAFELAHQLTRAGMTIPFLAFFGTPFPATFRRHAMLRQAIDEQSARALRHLRALASLPLSEMPAYLISKMHEREARNAALAPTLPEPVLALRRKVEQATIAAARRYRPLRYDGLVRLFVPSNEYARSYNEPLRWRTVAAKSEEYFGPGGCQGHDMLREPHAHVFAEIYNKLVTARD